MRRGGLLLTLALLAFVVASCQEESASEGVATHTLFGATQAEKDDGPFLLVALGSLGTVAWRCGEREDTYGLSFRGSGATVDVLFIVGRRLERKVTVHPGQTLRLPIRGLSQRLEVRQKTGAGTVRASVAVRFDRSPYVSHCFKYSPPRLSVRVTARR